MAGNIFINYRRGDDPGFTQALYSRLEQVFPSERLFMDVDNIAPGLDFVQVLNDQVARCDVLIAVIGKHWLDAADETGARRLDSPEDFVRIEIESALQQKKRVIPVLVNDATMPRSTELPEGLKAFARCNAVRLTHERFRADTQSLVKALEGVLAELEAARKAESDAAQRKAEEQERAEAERLRQKRLDARKRRATKPESQRGETEQPAPSIGVSGRSPSYSRRSTGPFQSPSWPSPFSAGSCRAVSSCPWSRAASGGVLCLSSMGSGASWRLAYCCACAGRSWTGPSSPSTGWRCSASWSWLFFPSSRSSSAR
jgi:hypothetical protein